MILSIIVYSLMLRSMSWKVWAGFVVLMLIHELGHVFALRWYRLRASPPIFIPFMGALINLRQNPPNAKVEAVVGIGGPIAGTIGALVCYWLAWRTNWSLVTPPELFAMAYLGILLNLFNMLPVPPLDGGRITAAISPWIWMFGVAGVIGLIVRDVVRGHPVNMILVLVILFAAPRVIATLKAGRRGPYYNISPFSSRVIAVAYLCLGMVLVFMYAIMTTYMRPLVGF
jgi:Zn-dependent protease